MSQAAEGRKWDNRQVGVVVSDIEKTLAYYGSLNLGPIAVRDFSFPSRMKGEPCNMNLKIGLTAGGIVQTELIEPGANAVVHAESLARRGDGGHHLGIYVSDLATEMEKWAKVGVGPLLRGGSPNGTIEFVYMDTAGIGGVIFEFIQLAPRLAPRFEETPQLGMDLALLRHVGVVVRDMGQTIDFYNSLGFGPFAVREVTIQNMQVAGRPTVSPVKIKLALSENCLLPIELIQPVSEGSIYHDTLERQGEGIQHVACWVSDLAGELTRLEPLGVMPLLGNERFAYLDTREVGGLMIELMERKGP